MVTPNNVGSCAKCGKASYTSRKEARRAARVLSRRGLNAFRCGDYWHLGHLPTVVSRGRSPRDGVTNRNNP